MGSGKTITSINIFSQYKGNKIIIGNDVSQKAFQGDLKSLKQDVSEYKFLTIQKLALLNDNQLLDLFSNAFIIIDEFQKLYSQQGLNSYGEQLKKLFSKKLKECYVILLSGTMFNSSVSELEYLLDIFGENEKTVETLSKHVITWTITSKMAEKKFQQKGPELEYPLIRLEMKQDQYEAYLQSSTEEGQFSNKNYLLPKYYWDGKKYNSNHIFKDQQVSKENLQKYSPISFYFIDEFQRILLKEKLKKTVAYIENINTQFGLMQYIEILLENGFIKYGQKPSQNTLCSICGLQMKEHKNQVDKGHYQPAAFLTYSADQTQNKRQETQRNFNSIQNIYGQQICLLLITSIAQTGLSLKTVSNFFILDNIPEISLYDQIIARAIRTASHDLLPEKDKYVKIYNLTISTPKYKELSKYEEKWLDIYKQDKLIKDFYKKLHKIDYNADIVLSNKKEEFEYDVLFNISKPLLFQYTKWFCQKFNTNNLQLFKVMSQNNKSNPFGISFDFIKDTDLEDILQYFYFKYRKYQPQYETIHLQGQPIHLKSEKKTKNVLDVLNVNYNQNQLRQYIKYFMEQKQDLLEQFNQNNIFMAFMIVENFVYMENDENQFVKNHMELSQQCHNKTIQDILIDIFSIKKKYKIQGYYQGNEVIMYDGKRKKIIDNFPQSEYILVFVIQDNSLPQYKLLVQGKTRDCVSYQPQFDEIWNDEKFIKQNDYYQLTQYQKYQKILLYSLTVDRFQPPQFIL